MRITILTQYYPPETGAPQNRLHSLAVNLKSLGDYVQVLTAMPNYPKSEVFEGYKGKKFVTEEIDGIRVYRTWIYTSKKRSVIVRLLNYLSFVWSSARRFNQIPKTDLLLVESPPLFLSWSAYFLANKWQAKVIFNVSDLWPESAQRLNIVTNKMLLRFAYHLEATSYRKAFLVTGQTMGIIQNIKRRFPEVKTHWLPNGVDSFVFDNIVPDKRKMAELGLAEKKVFIYAGIIGYAQALDCLIRSATAVKAVNKDFAMLIVGDGPVKPELEELNKSLGARVIFLPNIPKNQALSLVAASYAYVVPLRNLDIFKGAIPSKIFDPLALGIPVLLGVDGECREHFIDKGKAGWFFIPEQVDSLVNVILDVINNPAKVMEYGANGKAYVQQNFNRSHIALDFYNFIRLID